MIIETGNIDTQVLGTVLKERALGIDVQDIKYLTLLLSSNLYSHPFDSFIRETVSNGWDSHVEAGTTDLPIIIKFETKYHTGLPTEYKVTIRDYGTGISPERFDTIFCNIGSSTKRNTNDFIGGFGLGKLSGLSVSDTVTFISYYEGIRYTYLIIKDGVNISIKLLTQVPTEEKNGVEVSLLMPHPLYWYPKWSESIKLFPNIYIEDGGSWGKAINELKTKNYKHFKVASTSLDYPILIGNVLYPINYHKFNNTKITSIFHHFENTGIAMKFNIGELDITPNREEIIYNERTLNKIEEVAIKVEAEIKEIVNEKLKDCDDIIQYCIYQNRDIKYYPYKGIVADLKQSDPFFTIYWDKNCLYKGKELTEDQKRLARRLFNLAFIGIRSGRSNMQFNDITHDNILIVKGNFPLSNMMRNYIKDTYGTTVILTDMDFEKFHYELLNQVRSKYTYDSISYPSILSTEEGKYIAKELYLYIKNKAKILDTKNDANYLQYLADHKVKSQPQEKHSLTYVTLYIATNCDVSVYYKETIHLSEIRKRLLSYKKGVMLLPYAKKNDTIYNCIASWKRYIRISANEKMINYIKSMDLSCIVDTEKLMYDDPFMDRIYTLYSHFPAMDTSNVWILALKLYQQSANTDAKELVNAYHNYIGCSNYYTYWCKEHGKIDPYWDYMCGKFSIFVKVAQDLINYCGDGLSRLTEGTFLNTCINYIIIKNKLFRVHPSVYNDYKKSKLVKKYLCKH